VPSDPKLDPEMLAMFTMRELSYAQSKPNPAQTLAGIFAAKEAVLKSSNEHANISKLEVLPNLDGKPLIEGYAISISHSKDYVVAIAIHTGENLHNKTPLYEKSSDIVAAHIKFQGSTHEIKFNKVITLVLMALLILLEIIHIYKY
jgi:hypothetical protein